MSDLRLTYTLVFILFLNICLSYGQNLTGKIIDKNSEKSLEKVNIYFAKNHNFGTTTDKNGKFKLNLTSTVKDTDSLFFSIIGYKTYKTIVSTLKGKSNTIYLSKVSNLLNEITLQSKRKQSKLKFTKISSLENKVFSFASILIDDKIYISGGDKTSHENTFKKATDRASITYMAPSFEEVQRFWMPNFTHFSYNDKLTIYDINKNTFVKPDIKFEDRAYHQINYYKNNLYILGGKKISSFNRKEYLYNKIELFNIKNNHLQVDKSNPHQAVNFASFVYKDHIITMGGSTKVKKNGNKIYTDKIHLYNLKTGNWYEIGKMSKPKEVSGLLVDDKIYTIGGFNNKPISTIESWDLTTTKWTLEGELFSEIAYLTGFNNQKYFSKCFNKEYGISPTEYIKQNKENNEENNIKSINTD